ncbi:taurine transporter subunit, partial [Mesorhizobium sp. M1A.F.Ca.ET.072.01.1.1]
MTLAANSRTPFPPATAQLRPSPPPRSSASASTFGISLVTLAALIALWVLAAQLGWASPLFLPAPADVLTQFNAVAADGYANGTLLDHTPASLGRIAAAL